MTRTDLIHRLESELLVREGWPAYSNRPADKGGPTKGGITLKTLAEFRGRKCTIAELQALTEDEARQIYRVRYIRPWTFVPDDRLFAVCVDYAVTSGHDDPTEALQSACNVPVDGRLGPKTRAAVVAHPDAQALREYVIGWRVLHMATLAIDDAPMQVFIKAQPKAQIRNLRGWLNRTVSFLGVQR